MKVLAVKNRSNAIIRICLSKNLYSKALFTKVASYHLFSGHFAFVSEWRSFCLSRKIFSVSKNGQNRDIFASLRSDDHNSLTCNHFELGRIFQFKQKWSTIFLPERAKKMKPSGFASWHAVPLHAA